MKYRKAADFGNHEKLWLSMARGNEVTIEKREGVGTDCCEHCGSKSGAAPGTLKCNGCGGYYEEKEITCGRCERCSVEHLECPECSISSPINTFGWHMVYRDAGFSIGGCCPNCNHPCCLHLEPEIIFFGNKEYYWGEVIT